MLEFLSIQRVSFRVLLSLAHYKDIQCAIPSQLAYGTYQVSVALDGTTFTNESLPFTYICDKSIVCSNHGSCNTNGSCNCDAGWKGARCSIARCGDGAQDSGEAVR